MNVAAVSWITLVLMISPTVLCTNFAQASRLPDAASVRCLVRDGTESSRASHGGRKLWGGALPSSSSSSSSEGEAAKTQAGTSSSSGGTVFPTSRPVPVQGSRVAVSFDEKAAEIAVADMKGHPELWHDWCRTKRMTVMCDRCEERFSDGLGRLVGGKTGMAHTEWFCATCFSKHV